MKNLTKTPSRRNFLKKAALFTGAGLFLQTIARTVSAAASNLMVIDMSGKKRTDADNKSSIGIANGIGYVEDLKAALAAKKTTKADRPGSGGKVFKPADQTCDTCMFYNYKKETPAVPNCQLLPKVLVHAKGSCNSWTPMA